MDTSNTTHSVTPIVSVLNGNETNPDPNDLANCVYKENDVDATLSSNTFHNTNAQEKLKTQAIDAQHITNTQDVVITRINASNPTNAKSMNELSENFSNLEINTVDVTDTDYISRENPEILIEQNHVDVPSQSDLLTPKIDDELTSDPSPRISIPNEINTPNITDNTTIDKSDNFDPDLLAIVKFRPSRRSSIMKSLDYEIFTFNVYKNDHQAGMITDDPHLWTKVFQMYTRIKELIKEKKENKCSEFLLHLTFNEIKRIAISIKLITGIINIKGAHIKEWVANEFDSVKECAGTLKREEAPSLVLVMTTPTKGCQNYLQQKNKWKILLKKT